MLAAALALTACSSSGSHSDAASQTPTAVSTSAAPTTASPTTTSPSPTPTSTAPTSVSVQPHSSAPFSKIAHASTSASKSSSSSGDPDSDSDVPTVKVTTAPATSQIKAAASAAKKGGYSVGIAVLDTTTGTLYGSNANTSYATESVVKVFIATRLLMTGQMTGSVERTAYKMITQSDDASATALYGRVGGDSLLTWINEKFGFHAGRPPVHAGWWGNTYVSAASLARFYATVKQMPVVWKWLYNAMQHAHTYGSDGTYQFFGIPQATKKFAIKQGWGQDDDNSYDAQYNSTGFVDGSRYAVVILVRGPRYSYHGGTPSTVTSTAKKILPGGNFDLPDGT